MDEFRKNMEVAKLLSDIEKNENKSQTFLKNLSPDVLANTDIIGIFGSSGSGKSTLIGKLAKVYREKGKRVGIIAVDPMSLKSKGAFLGDRMRMKEVFEDDGVFIRSVSERNTGLGLNSCILPMILVLALNNFEKIFIETVGSGQTNVDLTFLCDITLLVISVGFGDTIQLMKAGSMEVADIIVLNKADLPDTDLLEMELKNAPWMNKEIVKISALENKNVDYLVEKVEKMLKDKKSSHDYFHRKTIERMKKQVELILFKEIRELIDKVDFDTYDIEKMKYAILNILCPKRGDSE